MPCRGNECAFYKIAGAPEMREALLNSGAQSIEEVCDRVEGAAAEAGLRLDQADADASAWLPLARHCGLGRVVLGGGFANAVRGENE